MSNKKICPFYSLVKNKIIALNNSLPDDVSYFWVTPEEIRDRLVFCGVHNSLSLKMVQAALQFNNKSEMYLKKRKYSGVIYYRSTEAHLKDKENSVPNEQRFTTGKASKWEKRICFNPAVPDYFAKTNDSNLHAINDALDKLEIIHQRQQERERSECI